METFLAEVNKMIGNVPIQRCYHCRKCTAGCPLAFAMEFNPDQIIRMIQVGRREDILRSQTIWLCVSCKTCVSRCPNKVDVARMMDVLRELSLEERKSGKGKNILMLHEAFLSSIKMNGRVNESLLIGWYKLKSGDLFSDLAMGIDMYVKGKLSLLASRTRDVGSVRKIFRKTKKQPRNGVEP